MNAIEQAVKILRAGGLVAFPTETVYGLGADATNADAVRKIFAAKGRPATNPVIVHVADVNVAKRYASQWPEIADQLAEAFWPGPLTMVLPRAAAIPNLVTAGGKTVGIRVPNHPLALELLRAFDGPIAAPSANRSNRISPTIAQHVRDELGDAVDLVLDGGPCAVGIESTVLDLTRKRPAILRPGGVSKEQIEALIGSIDMHCATVDETTAAASPGQQVIHYSPRTPAFRFDTSQRGQVLDSTSGRPIGLVTLNKNAVLEQHGRLISMPSVPRDYAQHLYAILRELDEMALEAIYIENPPNTPEWLAVRDRLARATTDFRPGLS